MSNNVNNNEKRCLPGFNTCEVPEVKEQKFIDNGVCLPGFNSCGVPEAPETKAPQGKPGACLPGYNSCVPAEEAAPAEAKNEVFDHSILDTDKAIVFYFSAPWCRHCKAYGPIVEEVVAANADAVKLVKIDIEEQAEIAEKFNVEGVPTVVVVKDKKIADVEVGARSKEEFKALIEKSAPAAPKAEAEEKVCLPGFNSCGRPEPHEEPKIVDDGVCRPGFNSCGSPETPEQPEPPKKGVCLPGFNNCG